MLDALWHILNFWLKHLYLFYYESINLQKQTHVTNGAEAKELIHPPDQDI